MNFFSTSAQISKEFNVPHSKVLETIDKLPYEKFRDQHIAIFDLDEGISLAQVTEAGYNATVFHLPVNDDNREMIHKFRETLFQNRAPNVLQAPGGTSSSPASAPGNGGSSVSTISDSAREAAKQKIAAGELDGRLKDTFADIHRDLANELGADPSYQSVRAYIVKRRNELNVVV